jgi:hypothetical protein
MRRCIADNYQNVPLPPRTRRRKHSVMVFEPGVYRTAAIECPAGPGDNFGGLA